MRKLIIILFLAPTLLMGQSLERDVLAAQGGYESGEEITVSWTLGESFTSTSHIHSGKVTEGFQQPMLEVKYIQKSGASSLLVNAYPNPTSGMLTIETFQGDDEQKITVWDNSGRELINMKTLGPTIEVDLSPYASGQYFVRIKGANTLKTALVSIIKH